MIEVRAPLAFFSADKVSADRERPGLLRAAVLDDPNNSEELEFHDCDLRDWSALEAPALHLEQMGFDAINLAGLEHLQEVLSRVRKAGEITTNDARQLRRELTGRVFRLSSGKCLRLLFIAPEGLIMRKAGPNGLDPDPDVAMSEMNGHDAALAIHGDQDVRGTPLKQMMRRLAPWLFRHQTPDGDNRWSPLMLVNLWIPLDQVTRPLTLMDRRTLDKRRHQLRYALPTDAFLDRNEDMVVNDIWTFLHDSEQHWYFSSDMDARSAYVFDTLGTPHGSTVLPGEEAAEQCYRAMQRVVEALRAGETDTALATAAAFTVSTVGDSTAALTQAIEKMQVLLQQLSQIEVADADGQTLWLTRAEKAMGRVVRKSLEMRVVAIQAPDFWPFNREKSRR